MASKKELRDKTEILLDDLFPWYNVTTSFVRGGGQKPKYGLAYKQVLTLFAEVNFHLTYNYILNPAKFRMISHILFQINLDIIILICHIESLILK